jgi:hypothetical protein
MIALGLLAATFPVSADDTPLPRSVWDGSQQPPENGLPDGKFAYFEVAGQLSAVAWYGSPTSRYQHGILGDAIEAGSLHVEYRDGRRYSLFLPETEVFEDRTPRLVDLDGDGRLEVVTIRSFVNAGASVAVFDVRDEKLVELAATEAIGRPNRWLNIAGIADYAGLENLQIAYVKTPHIGGTLYFVEWQGNKLVPIASMPGFSNHKIGSRDQNLSADIYYNNDGMPDLAVPSINRRVLKIVSFSNGKLAVLDQVSLPAELIHIEKGDANSGKNCVWLRLQNRSLLDICAPS